MSSHPTNDLVARLRTWGTEDDDCDSGELHQIMTEAADLIEQWEVLSLVAIVNESKQLKAALAKASELLWRVEPIINPGCEFDYAIKRFLKEWPHVEAPVTALQVTP